MEARAQTGLHMPAEWERHEATWLQWPYDRHHPGYQLQIERLWLMMVAALQDHEHVHILVRGERLRDHVGHQLQYFGIGGGSVDLHLIPYDDVWARDNGPTFVLDGEGQLAIINWQFSGWGKRVEHQLDNAVPRRLAERMGIAAHDSPLLIEGGAIEVNGAGSFMRTRSSILNPNRNPDLSQEAAENLLSKRWGSRTLSG
jgi:agmatine deiminase